MLRRLRRFGLYIGFGAGALTPEEEAVTRLAPWPVRVVVVYASATLLLGGLVALVTRDIGNGVDVAILGVLLAGVRVIMESADRRNATEV